MKIGFLISGVGIFGSVREIVECGNVFVSMGHECIIFNPEKESIDWLPFAGIVKMESKINNYKLDILIMTLTPNAHYLELFENAIANIKIFCFMGFDPKIDILSENSILKHIVDNYYLTADGYWQIDWLRKNTASEKIIDAQIGGINLDMFCPKNKVQRKELVIGWSGDHRKRKGGSALVKYFEDNKIEAKTYFGKNIPQSEMADWFNSIDIFIDNHYSGGWCNPVAEAMACKVPVICSDIECNSSFAIHGNTAFKFEFNDMEKLDSNLKMLSERNELRNWLIENAYQKIRQFDYNIVAKNFLEKKT